MNVAFHKTYDSNKKFIIPENVSPRQSNCLLRASLLRETYLVPQAQRHALYREREREKEREREVIIHSCIRCGNEEKSPALRLLCHSGVAELSFPARPTSLLLLPLPPSSLNTPSPSHLCLSPDANVSLHRSIGRTANGFLNAHIGQSILPKYTASIEVGS